MRWRVVVANIVLFVGFFACNYAAATWLGAQRSDGADVACLGSPDARRHVVYLHGLDSHAPSWQELDNRRVLAQVPDASFALPRAPRCGGGRCWPDADPEMPETIARIDKAARTCFGPHASYGVLGFSRGGFSLARIATCDAAGARWAIVASAFGYTPDRRLAGCPIAVVVGTHDRYQHAGAVDYARRIGARLFEFDGGHRLDAGTLAAAIDAVSGEPR